MGSIARMRLTRTLMLLIGVASAAGGCSQQPVLRYTMAAPAQGIDNVIYGSAGGPAYGAAQAPAYQVASPAYASPAPTYAAPTPTYAVAAAPRYAAPTYAGSSYAAPSYAVAAYGAYPTMATAQPVAYAPPGVPAYTLDSGDRLRVVVFGQDGLTNSYVLDASGDIQMPLIGTVSARGLTTDQLSLRIGDMLRQGYVREPHVAVEVEAYRPFFILGEVAQPGQYPYSPNMTVETAVAIAGGFGPRGLHSQVIISRNYNGQTIRYQAPLTSPVGPGDTIQVQERWF
jgi:protein involved in polysaccharide export with SLBB domain